MPLKGKTVNSPQMPNDITGLRGDVIGWLMNNGQAQGGAGGGVGPGTPNGPRLPMSPGAAGHGLIDGGVQMPVSKLGGNGYDQIFGATPKPIDVVQSGQTQIAQAPAWSNTQVGPAGQAQHTSAGGATDIYSVLPGFFQQAAGQAGAFGTGGAGDTSGFMGASAAGVRPVNDIASVAGMSQNFDQIANSQGVNGYFKDSVLTPYQKLFHQQRGDALAQAKESSGNLTGSGYANALGSQVNKSIAQEDATLSDILTSLVGQESGRQLNVAGLEQGRNVQNQNTDLARALADASNATNASIANAGASANLAGTRGSLLGQLLGAGTSLAQNQAGRTDAQNQFNAGQANDIAISNAQQRTQQALAQGQITSAEAQNYFNQLMAQNSHQADLNQNNNQFNASNSNQVNEFNTTMGQNASQQNAANFLQLLLGMTTTGVTAGQTQYQPGALDSIFAALPGLAQVYGQIKK